MLVVPSDAVLGTQPLDEIEIAFTVLGAVFAFRAGVDIEDVDIRLDTMACQHLCDDLRYCQVLENALVEAELQVVQYRHQGQVIARQAPTGFAHVHVFDMPMDPFAAQAELEKRRLTEQTLQVEIGVLAEQFDTEGIQGADGFGAIESQYLEVIAYGGDR